MEKEKLAKKAHEMRSKEDLLNLLNQMKEEEMATMGYADMFHPFTENHLNFYCNPNHAFRRYKEFKIKKKSGGFRKITAPRTKTFMLLLTYVNEIFKSIYTPSDYAMGFTEGRSVVTNAEVHKGQNYILNLDLKDFFPSIDQARVWKRLQLQPFNFAKPVCNLLAGLCAMKEKREMEDGSMKAFYVLPQGAPTSPIITNMICDTLDRRLAGLARRFNLNYTRYADDITFSSMHNVYQENGEFWKELTRIITDQGFRFNEEKTRLQKRGSRQEVTGVIVSDKLNVTQKYVRDIRNILYMWEKYGLNVAYSKFFPKYKAEKGHVKKGNPDLINVLGGKLLYLKMVKGEEDSVYKRLFEKYDSLVKEATSSTKKNEHEITYLETLAVSEFEKKNETEITITWSKESETSDQENIKDKKLKDNKAKKSHRYGYFVLDGTKILVTVEKRLSKDEEKDKTKLSISNCRDAKGKQFWLIHRSDKVTVKPPEPVDIDELNNELDSLLSI